jgi:hypothetical protein
MKQRILLSMALVLMLLVASAWAADVTGKWVAESQGRGGQPSTTTFTFKAEGAKLTGSVTSPGFGGGEPTVTEITDGKIDGDNISFVVVRKFGENEMKSTYKGKVAGDEITFTREFAMPPGGMGGPGGGGGGMGGPGGGGGGQAPPPIVAKRVK